MNAFEQAFLALAAKIDATDGKVIDDETGEPIQLDGVGYLVQNREEFAVGLFKERTFYLRSLYVDEDGLVHLDVTTTGGAIYEEETPDLVDLQHHKVMFGTLVRTYIFGLANGGCKPRPAPEPEVKAAAPEKKDDKKDSKKKKAIEPTYKPAPRRATGLSAPGVSAAQRPPQQAQQQAPQQQS